MFIQLKQKEEILYGKRYETIYAEEFIKNKTNNHFDCNFNNELSNFYKIDPCGIKDSKVTSVKNLKSLVNKNEVDEILKRKLKILFY